MPDWLQRLLPEGWTTTHLVIASIVLFVVMLVGSLLVCAWIIVKLPPDYFAADKPRRLWVDQHPIIRLILVFFKNLLGIALVALGIVLSLPGVPGQGILTIIIGMMLLDFPGRRKVEKWLLTRRGVLNAVNKLRARYGKAPMVLAVSADDTPNPPPAGKD